MSPLNEEELELAITGQTYNELCDQLGITDAETLKLADRYDGYESKQKTAGAACRRTEGEF